MEPLASKIRPKRIEEFIGQEHLVGIDKPLRLSIEKKQLFSFILWGPPGCGKTTLAKIYSSSLGASIYELSAVSSGKKDIQKILEDETKKNPKIIFLDEIHRFNKAQQDFLLPYVESGKIVLIGATTENPGFEVISPLLSRCRIFVLNKLSEKEIEKVILQAGFKIDKKAKDYLIRLSDGDARMAISVLENAYNLYKKVSLETLKESFQSRFLNYDKRGEEHYNIISAFIKSMRAGQTDASLYYLARMIKSGEDPKFIARRMIVFASEDVGIANPTAIVVANDIFRAVENVGLPECSINLATGAVYLSKCKKDRSSHNAYLKAMSDVKEYGALPVPLKLRNPSSKTSKELEYGKGYKKYSKESFLPEKIKNNKYVGT